MPFSISQFIRVNRVYFIWAVFMLLLYLFRNMFGLVFITFIMCFIVFSITGAFAGNIVGAAGAWLLQFTFCFCSALSRFWR